MHRSMVWVGATVPTTYRGSGVMGVNRLMRSDQELYDSLEDGSVQLIWTDPPFGTGNVQSGSQYSYKDGKVADTLEMMERLGAASARILTPDGVLAVCLDYRAVHQTYNILCEYLVPHGEIIWHFELGGVSKKWWTNKHNTILLFSVGDSPRFNLGAVPTSARKSAPKKGYTSPERRVNSVWNKTMGNTDPERVPRASQKPLDIVEPFVLVHTSPGELVIDPFMGSGTTLVAAQRNGREWRGADVDAGAHELTLARLCDTVIT